MIDDSDYEPDYQNISFRRPRQRDERHNNFIRGLPCIICGDNTSVECCHIRYSDARYGKVNPGVGQKPSDKYTLPMCGQHHREQHAAGDEREFWDRLEIDPIKVALQLYAVSGDHERGCEIVAAASG